MLNFGLPGIGGQTQGPQGVPLAGANEAHIMALSQQGNPGLTYGELMEQQSAQTEMQRAAAEQNIEVPKVNFYPSRHPNSAKARKQDIKQAYRLLKPAKRSIFSPRRWWIGGKYRYNKHSHVCVVDGCDCETLIRFDNLYMRISDEESGRSLYESYWLNPITGEPQAFVAKEGVTGGRSMRGTYCPEHLHLFHLLTKWEQEEDKEQKDNPKSIRDRVKRGVSTVAVPISIVKKKDNTPPMLQKYEQFFAELQKDSKRYNGINILHYRNPVTELNDVTMIVFDLRIFQHELEQMEANAAEAFQSMLQEQQQMQTQQSSIMAPQATMTEQQTNEVSLTPG